MDLKNSKCLVIGGAGFIGSFVVKELLKEAVSEVVIYDNFARGKMDNIKDQKFIDAIGQEIMLYYE